MDAFEAVIAGLSSELPSTYFSNSFSSGQKPSCYLQTNRLAKQPAR